MGPTGSLLEPPGQSDDAADTAAHLVASPLSEQECRIEVSRTLSCASVSSCGVPVMAAGTAVPSLSLTGTSKGLASSIPLGAPRKGDPQQTGTRSIVSFPNSELHQYVYEPHVCRPRGWRLVVCRRQ